MRERMMLVFLVGVFVGAFVGWNLPQPQWAKDVQAKATTLWSDTFK